MIEGKDINKELREVAGKFEIFRTSTGFCRTQDVAGTDLFIGRSIIKDEMEFHVALTRLIELYNEQPGFKTQFDFTKIKKKRGS